MRCGESLGEGTDQKRLLSVWRSYYDQGVVEPKHLYDLPVEMDEALDKLTGELGSQIRGMAVNLNSHAVKAAERQVAEVSREYRELSEQSDEELRDASLIISESEEKLKDMTAKHEAMRVQAERERSKALKLEAQVNEMAHS